MTPDSGILLLLAAALLYWWARDHAKEHYLKEQERQDQCPHPPEQQRTMRVNNILSWNPGVLHRVIPGQRWLMKHCDACGKQWQKYSPTLQPWDEYVAEYRQETIDREAQYKSRERIHLADLKQKERERDERHRTGQS